MIVKPCLRKKIKERGWTQYETAKRAHIAQAYVSRFDSQISHKDKHLFLLAKALNCQIEDLFEQIDDDSQQKGGDDIEH